MKICNKCHTNFKPSSNHKTCPKCRAKARKVPCACGNLMRRDSTCCASCSPKVFTFLGETNPNWKGGFTRHKKGYVLRKAPEHPRSVANSGYVFEHILVMEEHLGRHLIKGETVHHLNGVKDDNRIENLELWVKPQPSGIRAKDAIAWAKEILSRYGDLDSI